MKPLRKSLLKDGDLVKTKQGDIFRVELNKPKLEYGEPVGFPFDKIVNTKCEEHCIPLVCYNENLQSQAETMSIVEILED